MPPSDPVIRTFVLGDYQTNCFVVRPSSEARRCWIVDCGFEPGPLLDFVAAEELEPQAMLLTEEWPAPAVATWKAVAEALSYGLDSIPSSARWAMLWGGGAGLVLGILEIVMPSARARYLPSAVALGLAFVIPASISIIMALGALIAWVFTARFPSLAARFVIAAAAGLVAGESIIGVAASFWDMAR